MADPDADPYYPSCSRLRCSRITQKLLEFLLRPEEEIAELDDADKADFLAAEGVS
jgi:hypothetical protein